jgi:uncharacterized membrane protein (UPF0127 family)
VRDAEPGRRQYVRLAAGLGTGALAGLAGCAGENGGGADGEAGDGPTPTSGSTPTPTRTATGAPTASPEPTATPVHADYETTEIRAVTPDDELLGTVTAAIADTSDLRYLGLSDTESLPEDRGMLFVYDDAENRSFVMRRMDFGIDIVYAGPDGEITEIHHAEAPGPDEDGNDQRYPGWGQYVLEVNLDWTTERGVEAGDRLAFDL